MKKPITLLALLILISIGLCKSQDVKSGYRISDKIHLDGDGGWDYLVADDSTSQLYVSHATIVQVVDLKKKKVIAQMGAIQMSREAVYSGKVMCPTTLVYQLVALVYRRALIYTVIWFLATGKVLVFRE